MQIIYDIASIILLIPLCIGAIFVSKCIIDDIREKDV